MTWSPLQERKAMQQLQAFLEAVKKDQLFFEHWISESRLQSWPEASVVRGHVSDFCLPLNGLQRARRCVFVGVKSCESRRALRYMVSL